MTTLIKTAIDIELANINDVAEDESAGIDVLKAQLERAKELHSVIEDSYEKSYALCSQIEEWISEEK